eukprot:6770247-Pyramimonas_sp.AAC.1
MATPNSRPLKDAQRKNQAEASIDNALASSGSRVPMEPTSVSANTQRLVVLVLLHPGRKLQHHVVGDGLIDLLQLWTQRVRGCRRAEHLVAPDCERACAHLEHARDWKRRRHVVILLVLLGRRAHHNLQTPCEVGIAPSEAELRCNLRPRMGKAMEGEPSEARSTPSSDSLIQKASVAPQPNLSLKRSQL